MLNSLKQTHFDQDVLPFQFYIFNFQFKEVMMPVTPEKDPYYRLRHSAAHVMAEAVLQEFPDGKVAIGPPIEDGFYYDFELPRPLTPEDLAAIEDRMRTIIKGKFPFVYREVSANDARALSEIL